MKPQQLMKQIQDTRAEEALITAFNVGGQASLSDIEESVGDQMNAIECAEYLRSLGLAQKETSIAREVTLTSTGKDVAELIEASRSSGAARRAAVQLGILRWLSLPNSYSGSTEGFVNTDEATAYGTPFTEQEIHDETEWLLDKNLIKGTKAWGGTIVRPEISSQGRDVLDSGERPGDFLRMGTQTTTFDQSSHSINVAHSQNLAIQQGGANNYQKVDQNNQQSWNEEVAAHLETLINQLSTDASVSASELKELRNIKAETESEAATKETIMSKFLSWASQLTTNPLVTASIPALIALLG